MTLESRQSESDPWANWGENRDEYPVRDNRWNCPRCQQDEVIRVA